MCGARVMERGVPCLPPTQPLPLLHPGHVSSPYPAPTARHCHQADTTRNVQAADKIISLQPMIPQSCSDREADNSLFFKEKGCVSKAVELRPHRGTLLSESL